MTRVFLWPDPVGAPKGTGIGRIVHAQYKYLPEMGVELVSKAEQAEVFAVHTQQGVAPRVDVLHVHGMYFEDIEHQPYSSWHQHANHMIAQAARKAITITVPSWWVGEPFRRDMRIDPEVIGHGIEPEEWSPGENGGYILWNKSRNLDVCDPTPAYKLSRRGHLVWSTFSPVQDYLPNPAFRVIGHQTWEEMQPVIRSADIYLATTRETFGVGTLEAMACGIPVLGYAWGGTLDIVQHKVDGYLAAPGDLDDLEAGLLWLRENRASAGQAAAERVKDFRWEKCMAKYVALYDRTADFLRTEKHRVAVVIPAHNYGRFLKQAVHSVMHQSISPDEIIVVDDGSKDNTSEVVQEFSGDPTFRCIHHDKPTGVAEARNHGIREATSELVVCLDADDWLDPRYLEYCRKRFTQKRELGVVYTGLDVSYPDGMVRRSGWPPAFSWESQSTNSVPPSNCVPSAAMFRRSMWLRSGGYRQAYAPGEDAEFWTRSLALGFEAEQLTDMPLFHYRVHADSASRTKNYVPINEHHPWMVDRIFPLAAPSLEAPRRVVVYAEPLITVLLMDHSGEEPSAIADSLDDLLGQSIREWEVIVCSRRGSTDLLRMYPFARWAWPPENSLERSKGSLVAELFVGQAIDPGYLREELEKMVARGIKSSAFREGSMGECCGGGADAVLQAKRILGTLDEALLAVQPPAIYLAGGMYIRMEFKGDRSGGVTYHGREGRLYRGGSNALHRYANVHRDDVSMLLGTGVWRTVAAPPAPPEEQKAEVSAEISR